MVYTGSNRIHFGNGDVSVLLSMSGTRKAPQAMLVFQNREPTQIGRIEEDADLSKTAFGVFDPRKDFAMYFPSLRALIVSFLLFWRSKRRPLVKTAWFIFTSTMNPILTETEKIRRVANDHARIFSKRAQ